MRAHEETRPTPTSGQDGQGRGLTIFLALLIGEVTWSHGRLHHRARLITERDGTALIPAVTNLPTLVDTATAVRELRAQPLKLAADNARRWLLGTLGNALATSDNPDDLESSARMLLAMLRAPGTARFEDERGTVTLELPLSPTPHARLAASLLALDEHALMFTDGCRRVYFRLAPRPTRADISAGT